MDTKQIAALVVAQANSIREKIITTGALTEEQIQSEIATLDLTQPERVDVAAHLIEMLSTESEHWKSKAKYFDQVAKSFTNFEKQVRDGIKIGMVGRGESDAYGVDMRFKLSEREPKVEINEAQLPESYMKQDIRMIPDSVKIALDAKLGKEIPGVKLLPVLVLNSYVNKKKVTA